MRVQRGRGRVQVGVIVPRTTVAGDICVGRIVPKIILNVNICGGDFWSDVYPAYTLLDVDKCIVVDAYAINPLRVIDGYSSVAHARLMVGIAVLEHEHIPINRPVDHTVRAYLRSQICRSCAIDVAVVTNSPVRHPFVPYANRMECCVVGIKRVQVILESHAVREGGLADGAASLSQ